MGYENGINQGLLKGNLALRCLFFLELFGERGLGIEFSPLHFQIDREHLGPFQAMGLGHLVWQGLEAKFNGTDQSSL